MSFISQLSISLNHTGRFWQEKFNSQFFRWNIFLIILQLLIVFFKFNSLPPQIPLFYSAPWGESRLASASSIFILPLLSLVIWLLNNFLAVFFLKSSHLLSRLLVITSLIFSLLTTVTLYQIIFLVS